MDTNNLGKLLKERRKVKKLTLTQLQAKSGVTLSHLGRIEKGTRFPSAKVLSKLSEPLGFSELELLKLAGYLHQDDNADRLLSLKQEFKREIGRIFLAQANALIELYKKIDSL